MGPFLKTTLTAALTTTNAVVAGWFTFRLGQMTQPNENVLSMDFIEKAIALRSGWLLLAIVLVDGVCSILFYRGETTTVRELREARKNARDNVSIAVGETLVGMAKTTGDLKVLSHILAISRKI